jgi:hypothetical protein
MTYRNTIVLNGEVREESAIADVALIPGMLVEYDQAEAGQVKLHATDGGNVIPVMFVREQHENDGHGISDQIAQDDTCTVVFPTNGARINAITEDTITVAGVALASSGNGLLRIADLEAGDVPIGASGGPSVAEGTRLRVPVIIGAAANIVGGGYSF